MRDDGIELDKIVGVRDFADWRTRRVAAFATFGPVAVTSTDPRNLKELLDRHPFAAFPVVRPDGTPAGVASRDDIARASGGQVPLCIHPATCVNPESTIGEIQIKLVEAELNLLLLVEPARGALVGLFTLHDLLRSQIAASDTAA